MFVEITELSKHDLGELTCKYRHIKKRAKYLGIQNRIKI